MMDTEKAQLLDGLEDNSMGVESIHIERSYRSKCLRLSTFIHITLCMTYTALSVLYIQSRNSGHATSIHRAYCPFGFESIKFTALVAIAGLEIRYHSSPYSDYVESPFAGPPSPRVDNAWHELLANISIRVSGAELKASNQTSVQLPEGGGYMAWLGVYHELHCIVGRQTSIPMINIGLNSTTQKMLRQWNYREHYHPNISEEERTHWDIHAGNDFRQPIWK